MMGAVLGALDFLLQIKFMGEFLVAGAAECRQQNSITAVGRLFSVHSGTARAAAALPGL